MIKEYTGLFTTFCEKYIESLPEEVIRILQIGDVKEFCRNANFWFNSLVESFYKEKEKFKEMLIQLGVNLYRKEVSIAFVVDAINAITYEVLRYIHDEKLPFKLSEEFIEIFREIPNIIAYAYIKESIEKKEELLKAIPEEEVRKAFKYHFSRIREIINGENTKLDVEECPLKQITDEIAFKIGCKKLQICEEVERIHNLIHLHLSTFGKYVLQGKFLSAYLLLVSIFFLLEKLSTTVRNINTTRKNIDLKDVVSFILEDLKGKASLFVIDPTDLSFINKTFGYQIGDEIFTFLEKKLGELLPKNAVYGTVKCTTGVLCTVVEKNSLDYEVVFRKLRKELQERYENFPAKVDISGFLIRLHPDVKVSKEELADVITFASKKSKERQGLLIIDLKSSEVARNIIVFKSIVGDLLKKIKSGEIHLALQEIREVKSNEIKHYEVLFRIRDEKGEIIPAYKIIDYLYELRIIYELDLAVMKKIKENLNIFRDKFIFINISPATFKVPRAVKEIREITEVLISSKLKFGFEITEQAIIEDLRVLKEFFKDLEIPISIDDFGTGYSSFSQLINLVEKIPIKYLKIDGSYVKLLSTDNRKKAVAVIKSINSMAHAMEIETIAEFVENEEILKHLQYLDVDYGQGYLFGKPEIVI